jgi:hypothetical protein
MSQHPPIPDQPTLPEEPPPGRPEDVPDVGTPEPDPGSPPEPGSPPVPPSPQGMSQ